jgi:WD40 repeat protein
MIAQSSAVMPGLPQTAKVIADLRGHLSAITAVAFSPDRCLLASADSDGTARIWNVATSKPGERGSIRKVKDSLRSLVFSPNSRMLALGSGPASDCIWLYDVSEKTAVESTALRGARGAMQAAFSPDGKLIAAGGDDNTVRIWEPGPNFRGDPRTLLMGHTKPILALAFAPDGQTLATASRDQTVRLWTLSRIRSSQRALLQHPADVEAVAYHADGKTIITAARDNVIRFWDTTAIKPVVRTEIKVLKGNARLILSPSHETLVGIGDGTRVTNWDTRTSKVAGEWEIPGGAASCVALTPDGRYMARGSDTGGVGVYRVAEKRS